MANFNKVIMAGRLTRDPQLSYLPSNTPVTEFGLATNRKWRGQDGEMKDDTCFVECRVYGKQAETLNQYMSKGRGLLIEGHLQFQQWTGKDGTKRSKHIVIVEQFQFMDGRREDGPGDRPTPQAAGAPQSAPAMPGPESQEPAPAMPSHEAPAPADADIPF